MESLPRAPTPPHAYWRASTAGDDEYDDEERPSRWWFVRRRRRRRVALDSFSSSESSGRWRRLSSLTSRGMVGEDGGSSLRTFGGLIQFRDRRASVVTVARSPSFNSVSPWDSALFAKKQDEDDGRMGTSFSRRSLQAQALPVIAAVYMTAR